MGLITSGQCGICRTCTRGSLAKPASRSANTKSSPPRERILDTGLWAWSRHPNYCGELGFWLGLFLFGLAAYPTGWWWMILGVVLMTLMFLFASIPMMEKRSLERRPEYQQIIDSTSMLIPWPPRR